MDQWPNSRVEDRNVCFRCFQADGSSSMGSRAERVRRLGGGSIRARGSERGDLWLGVGLCLLKMVAGRSPHFSSLKVS